MNTEVNQEAAATNFESNNALTQYLSNDQTSIASSQETVIGLPALSRCNSGNTISEISAALDEADRKLQAVLATEGLADNEEPSVTPQQDPYRNFQCQFGWTGALDAPEAVPKSKAVFMTAIKDELNAVTFVKDGIYSYMLAVTSGKHHVFADDFLTHQTTAYAGSMEQLDTIEKNLLDVVQEVDCYNDDDAEIDEELLHAFIHARPWIARIRRILMESHVFYKVNYVLASSKKIFQNTHA